MRWIKTTRIAALICALAAGVSAQLAPLDQAANTWVKRSPLSNTPASPRLGYEGPWFGTTSTA
jgi:hypothetical protein